MRRFNRKFVLSVAVALGAAGVVVGSTGAAQGQDAGLPTPARGDDATPTAFAPATRAPMSDGFALEHAAWGVSGRDAQRGDYTGTMTFQRRGRRLFEFERRLAFARGGEELERGKAAVSGGFLYCEQEVPQDLGGLRGVLGELSGGAASTRLAVYRLAPDGRRLEGRFKFTRSLRTGVERLEPAGSSAADNQVTLLVDGGEMFPALRDALAGAQRSICLQTFIYRDDATGRSVARILAERARAGVEVRVLVDNFGNKLGGLKRELEAAGVEVMIQHGWGEGIKNTVLDAGRSLWDGIKRLFGGGKPKARERRGVFNHDHRKIIVVDGALGFCGGMNIGVEYEREWHDVHASVQGSAVAALEDMFYERWRAAGGRGQAAPAVTTGRGPGTMAVDVVGALPGISTAIKDRYLQEIAGARSRVLIENAYFLDDDVIAGMQGAVRRGVRTVLILPPDDNHDVPIVRDAFDWAQNDVVRSGVELYKYRDRMVHSKVAAFDGRVATVGSSNLDNMALTLLAEANIFVMDPGFARTLEQRIFARDIPMSDRVRERELSWWQKVKSGTLHFFRGLL